MTATPIESPEAFARWLGPWLVEVGLVKASSDPRVEELAELLAAEIVAVKQLAPPPRGPWKVVAPFEYAGPNNHYATNWIVRSDEHPGLSAILGNATDAIAVRDTLNRPL